MRKTYQTYILLLSIIILAMIPLKVQYDYKTLGQWDGNGKPLYLDGRIPVSTDLVNRTKQLIQDSLVMSANEFLNRNSANIILRGEGEVFVTLLYEDAGWKNTLGFYTYDVNNIPQTIDELGDLTIIFPNLDSPGVVDGGMRVSLGTFPENTVFGFFLVTEGWNNGITNGNYTLYTNDDFNEDLTSSTFYNQMTIIFPNELSTAKSYDLLLCLEDNVDLNLGDYDYDDAVFQLESSPASILDQIRHDANRPPIASDTLIVVYPNDELTLRFDSLVYEPDDYIDYSSLEIISVVDPNQVDNIYFTNANLTVEISEGTFDTLEIEYKVCDTGYPTLCDTGVVQLVLGNLNLPPKALKDSIFQYSEELSILGIPLDVLGSDPDNNLNENYLEVISSQNDVFFTVVENSGLRIIPNLDATGIDTVFFEICDLGFPIYCDTGFILVSTPVVPTAINDTISIPSGEERYVDVLVNDLHPDDDINPETLRIIEETTVDGVINVIDDGRILHTTPENYEGSYNIRYEICDNSIPADCDDATLTILVTNNDTIGNNDNLPPIARDEVVYTEVDQSIKVSILKNDYDQDGRLDYFSVKILTEPLNGSILLDGSISNGDTSIVAHYYPNKGFIGVDIFSYEVSDHGIPKLNDDAIVIVYIGDEGFDADNAPLYWVDSVEVKAGDSYYFDYADYLDQSAIDFSKSTTTTYGSPDLVGATINLFDGETIKYNSPDSIAINQERDYVYYKVCNDNAECGYGLLIITILQDGVPTSEVEVDVTIYNGFSPNNDNINDSFTIKNIDNYPDNTVKIFNRWGQEIYNKNEYINDWKGINNSGEPLPDGTYFYILTIINNKETFTFNGYVVLKR